MFKERLVAFEKRLQEMMPEIRCPVHLCLGQENVSDALHDVLKPEDWLFSTHRNHGHYLAKGGDESRLMDEIMGLSSGINDGFMGSMGIIDPARNFYAGSIVAGTVGIAAGVAYGLKHQGKSGLVVIVCGDGATDQGVFWESMNFIALHKLPVFLVIENNEYSVHVHQSERSAMDISHKIRAFGISGCKIFDSLNGTKEWIEIGYKNAQKSPFFVEVMVKRECNHANNMKDLREVQ